MPTPTSRPTRGDLSPLAGHVFEAILFDNDGTLVNSIEAVEAAWSEWAAEFDIDPARLTSLHGKPAEVTVGELVPPEQRAHAFARITEIELTSPHPTVALPGAADAVTATVGRNAIVTSAEKRLFERRASEAGIPAPTVTVTVDDVAHGKPHPEPYLLAARRLGADPAHCLVVEDAPAGVAAGHAAGALVLGIDPGSERAMEAATDLDADAIVHDLSAVVFVPLTGGFRVEAAR